MRVGSGVFALAMSSMSAEPNWVVVNLPDVVVAAVSSGWEWGVVPVRMATTWSDAGGDDGSGDSGGDDGGGGNDNDDGGDDGGDEDDNDDGGDDSGGDDDADGGWWRRWR